MLSVLITLVCWVRIFILFIRRISSNNLSSVHPTLEKKMNSKHLATGSPFPPLPTAGGDKPLRIYSMRFCPFAQRPLLVAAAKGIPLDIVNVNLKQKPEWLFEKNPGGKVPTVETSDGCLYESVLVSEYLDEAYLAGRALCPKDPFHKTLDRIWIQNTGRIADAHGTIVMSNGDEQKVAAGASELREGHVSFEQELKRRGTTYFGGNEAPGMLDYMLWPFIERVPALKILYEDKVVAVGLDKFPTLDKWRHAMEDDPAVKAILISPENHAIYRRSGANGAVPNYDLLAGQ